VGDGDRPLAVQLGELVGPEEPRPREGALRIAEPDRVDEVVRGLAPVRTRRDAHDPRLRPAELVRVLLVDRLHEEAEVTPVPLLRIDEPMSLVVGDHEPFQRVPALALGEGARVDLGADEPARAAEREHRVAVALSDRVRERGGLLAEAPVVDGAVADRDDLGPAPGRAGWWRERSDGGVRSRERGGAAGAPGEHEREEGRGGSELHARKIRGTSAGRLRRPSGHTDRW
jgi:hypothetical protein